MLKVRNSHIPERFVEVLTYGLQPNAANRKMNMEHIRDVLSLMPRVSDSDAAVDVTVLKVLDEMMQSCFFYKTIQWVVVSPVTLMPHWV